MEGIWIVKVSWCDQWPTDGIFLIKINMISEEYRADMSATCLILLDQAARVAPHNRTLAKR